MSIEVIRVENESPNKKISIEDLKKILRVFSQLSSSKGKYVSKQIEKEIRSR